MCKGLISRQKKKKNKPKNKKKKPNPITGSTETVCSGVN